MITPVILDELFEVNHQLKLEYDEKNRVVVIDDFYKNFNDIISHLENQTASCWKGSDNNRNFVEYYDSRVYLQNTFYGQKYVDRIDKIIEIIRNHFGDDQFDIVPSNPNILDFNYFKHIKNIPNKSMQFYPHTDSPYAGIVYMDNVSAGGTAFYELENDFINKEHEYLFYDVENIDKTVIQSKPNRLVLFEGTRYHGAYIEHEKYLDSWRINQVMFFDKIKRGYPYV